MRYFALATDYDGTLAHHGRVDAATLEALERLAATGRKLILVTGRELGDLQSVFPAIARFDLVVAENGALLYTPATQATSHARRCCRGGAHAGMKPPALPRSVRATLQRRAHGA